MRSPWHNRSPPAFSKGVGPVRRGSVGESGAQNNSWSKLINKRNGDGGGALDDGPTFGPTFDTTRELGMGIGEEEVTIDNGRARHSTRAGTRRRGFAGAKHDKGSCKWGTRASSTSRLNPLPFLGSCLEAVSLTHSSNLSRTTTGICTFLFSVFCIFCTCVHINPIPQIIQTSPEEHRTASAALAAGWPGTAYRLPTSMRHSR